MTPIVDAAQPAALPRPRRPDHRSLPATPGPVDADRHLAVDGSSTVSTLKGDLCGRAGKPAISNPVFLAASLAELILSIAARAGDESMWAAITDTAAMLIPGAEQAGITTTTDAPPPAPAAIYAAPGITQMLIKAHDSTGEGPCLDAASGRHQVRVHDLHTDVRWPQLAARAPWELRSLLCTPIVVSGASFGALVAVSTRAWAFDDASAQLATVVATYAGLSLTHVEQLRNLRVVAEAAMSSVRPKAS